jgi:hypothetical protein
MIILTSEQGTAEWFEDRAGAITASMFTECRKRLKSGPNKGGHTTAGHNYAFKLAVERIKGGCIDQDQYETYAMRRGNELEHEARLLHEQKVGVFVEQSGVLLTEDRKFGYSSDGFIGEDGLAEYKCFLDGSKVREIMFNDATDDVNDQVQGGMWISGRQWCDFALYYPDLECIGLNLTVNRVQRDEEYIELLVADLLAFDELVESYIERIDLLAEKQKNPAFESINIADEASIEDIF